MKRFFPAALLFLVAACHIETVTEEFETRVLPVDTEFIDGQPTVYATLEDGFTWVPGDSISVLETNGSEYQFHTFTTAGSGSRAMFIGPVLENGWSMTGSALYPANPSHEAVSSGFRYKLENYFLEENGCKPLSQFSSVIENRTLSFKPVSGAVALNFSDMDPLARYTVQLEGTSDIWGTYSLSADGVFDKASVTDGGPLQSVSVRADAEGKAVAVFPLVPGSYPSLSLSVIASSGKLVYSRTLSDTRITSGILSVTDISVPVVLTPEQALGALSDWESVPNVYSSSNVHGGTPDMYNQVATDPSPTQILKFRSDKDFLYCYIQIDTTKFIYRLEEKRYSGPKSCMNNLSVWADSDEVHSNQSVRVDYWWRYTGYDYLIRGAAFDACKPKVWKPALRYAGIPESGSEIKYGGNAFGSAVVPAPTDIAYGDGTLSPEGIIDYYFVVSRDALGIAGLEKAHIGISFEEGWAGWSAYTLVPDVNGFDVELVNE